MTRLLSLLSLYTLPRSGHLFLRTSRSRLGGRKRPRSGLFLEGLEQRSLLTRLSVEPLEGRVLPSGVSIFVSDASAIEGSSTLKFIDQFVAPGSGGLSRPRESVVGPDGNLYVVSADTNSILRYNGVTGAFMDTFVASGSGGLNGPGDLVFGPDGDLYVSSLNNSGVVGTQVLRYDGSTGAFLNVVASGLDGPDGVTFGPDGSLYIANQDGNDIVRENSSGQSVFVAAGGGGLSQPQKAVFGPDGNLYVGSSGTGQVLRYNGQTGAFMDVFANTDIGQGLTQGPKWLEFGSDGYLYTTVYYPTNTIESGFLRFNANTGAFVDALVPNPNGVPHPYGWSFNLGPGNVVYDSGNALGNFVDRYGPSSLASFTVSLSSASSSPVTVHYATADGTALAGKNYLAASGTLTFTPGLTSQTILVQTLDDGVISPTKNLTLTLSNPVGARLARGQGTGSILEGDSIKFYVVDAASTASTYRYGYSGNLFGNSALGAGDTAPRGVASNAAGTTLWVADANQNVYVYNPSGTLLGSWAAGGLPSNAQLTGIATNGTDIWLVANNPGKIYKYSGAASRLSGTQSADSSFSLSSADSDPEDMVTDGTSFWVVDSSALQVFKYKLTGRLLGSWTIDPVNTSPTGITINPNNVSDIWIVDNGTLNVYQYTAAAGLTSGSQYASAVFALAPGEVNPQGIADPPAPDTALTAGDGLVLATPMLAARPLPDSSATPFVQTVSLSSGLVSWLGPTAPVQFTTSSNADRPAFPATTPLLVEWTRPAEGLAMKMPKPDLIAEWTPVPQDRALDQVFSDPSLGLINDELLMCVAAGA